MRSVILLGVTLALCAPLGALAQTAPGHSLDAAEESFRQQHYQDTVSMVRGLLYPKPKLRSVEDVHRSREILGASYWQLKDFAKAEREWQFLLIARPGFQLDTFYYPKAMRLFFQNLRQTLIQQGIIGQATDIPKAKPEPRVLQITQVIERRSRATAFIPFGVGQFDNGHEAWGWFFLSTEATALATSLSTSFAYQFLPTAGGPFTFSDNMKSTAKALYWTSVISGAVFAGLATWGIIDANISHEPMRVVSIEKKLEPVRTVDTRTPQPQEGDVLRSTAAGGSR